MPKGTKRRPVNKKRTKASSQSVKELSGECPPFYYKSFWVSDPHEGKIYMVGGMKPEGDDDNHDNPTSDFYCLDVPILRWKDLTNSLIKRNIELPWSSEDCRRTTRNLPKLSFPGCALLRLHGTSFLLLFGGFDVNADYASSKLIVVNLRHLEWWYQPIEGGPVVGRINPTMVIINKNLYIFGGYRHFEDDGGPHSSYCIAALSDDGKGWVWEARDIPYPSNVPQRTIFGKAVPIYFGAKILLTPWRTANDSVTKITFTDNNIFCFHVARRRFQLVDVSGDFPQDLKWYYNISLDPPELTTGLHKSNTSAHRDGPQSLPLSTSAPTFMPPPSSSALICGWVELPDGTILSKFWLLELTPTETICNLEIPRTDFELDLDIRYAVGFQDLLFIFGSSDSGGTDAINSSLDIAFEVPLRSIFTSGTKHAAEDSPFSQPPPGPSTRTTQGSNKRQRTGKRLSISSEQVRPTVNHTDDDIYASTPSPE